MGIGAARLIGASNRKCAQTGLREAATDLLYREIVALFAVLLALAPPAACQHGPMSLLDPTAHDRPGAHADHLGYVSPSAPQPGDGATLETGFPNILAANSTVCSCCLSLHHEIRPAAAALTTMALGLSAGVMSAAVALPPPAFGTALSPVTLGLRLQTTALPVDPPPRPA